MSLVSIIVPCYNEEATIRLLLKSIYTQSYPHHEIEVILADGMSTDRTRSEVAAFRKEFPDLLVKVVDNPKRIIPAALNFALEAAQGEFIIRLDGHSMPYPEYVERCIADLKGGKGDNVGGVWEIHPAGKSWIARSIAAAAAHPLGVGDAFYRFTDRAEAVDTVPFGAFRRSLFEEVGHFNENLLTNEDYEFNTRIRKRGGVVWLDPAIRSVYFARSDLGALAKQYWRYGYWKLRMLRRYPGTLRWRQALPPLFVSGCLALALLSSLLVIARWMLVIILILYFTLLVLGSLPDAYRQKDPRLLIGIPLAIATMHFSWGAGFLWSLIGK
ncbi:MAG: glycosyltransferase family 2 protein [Anaerolineaceae bacterium]|jgi:glycosyltransferase involved in cell wall biosynthesis